MQIFKTKPLARFTRKEGISDASLKEAIERAERGVVDADLGDGLIKQRVARQGKGRSGGYRMVIAYRAKNRSIFLLGFAKSDLDNINDKQLASLQVIGNKWLYADAATLAQGLNEGILIEVKHGN